MARIGDMENRHNKILELLSKESVASVAYLSATLGVTKETIRKDLAYLYDAGKISRIHGGAALADTMPFRVRKGIAEDEKRHIAACACEQICRKDSIIIESSTTNILLGDELLRQEDKLKTLTIITNSLRLALLLEFGRLCGKLFLLGGYADADEENCHGAQTVEALRQFHVDKAFLSAAAVDARMHMTAYKEHDMLFQRQAIACAADTYVLVNKKKIPSTALYHVCNLSEVTGVITDADLNADKEYANIPLIRV